MQVEKIVEIKGTKSGLAILIDSGALFDVVLNQLDKKLADSNNFFSGAEVDIYVGDRVLSSEERKLLKDLVERKYTLYIREFIHKQGPIEEKAGEIKSSQRSIARIERNSVNPLKKPRALTHFGDPILKHEEDTLFLRRTIRSGQTIEYPGNIVILGDVNPGSYLIAGGDIIVLGRLRGVAHAGAQGFENAVVIALQLNPSQLRIAQYIGRSPDNEIQDIQRAEKAYVKDGEVVIESIL